MSIPSLSLVLSFTGAHARTGVEFMRSVTALTGEPHQFHTYPFDGRTYVEIEFQSEDVALAVSDATMDALSYIVADLDSRLS